MERPVLRRVDGYGIHLRIRLAQDDSVATLTLLSGHFFGRRTRTWSRSGKTLATSSRPCLNWSIRRAIKRMTSMGLQRSDDIDLSEAVLDGEDIDLEVRYPAGEYLTRSFCSLSDADEIRESEIPEGYPKDVYRTGCVVAKHLRTLIGDIRLQVP